MKCSPFVINGNLYSFSLCILVVFITVSLNSVFAKRYKYTLEMLMDFDYLVSQLYVQQCTFVEIGEGICSMFVELPIGNKGYSKGEMFFGNCLCSEFRKWQLCNRHLSEQRPDECTFDEDCSHNDTSARVHRRLCDVTGMSQWNLQCNCSTTLIHTQQETLCGFRTCFAKPMPTAICKPLSVCGVNYCDISLHGALYAVRCDPMCKGQKPFCERPGFTTSERPHITSEWSAWQTVSPSDDTSLQQYVATCLDTNKQPAFDCIGPGLKCCGQKEMDCICEVREEDGLLKAFRYTIVLKRQEDKVRPTVRVRSATNVDETQFKVWNRLMKLNSNEENPNSIISNQTVNQNNIKPSTVPDFIRLFDFTTTKFETHTSSNALSYKELYNIINNTRNENYKLVKNLNGNHLNAKEKQISNGNFNLQTVVPTVPVAVTFVNISGKNVNLKNRNQFSIVDKENVNSVVNIQISPELTENTQDTTPAMLKHTHFSVYSKTLSRERVKNNHVEESQRKMSHKNFYEGNELQGPLKPNVSSSTEKLYNKYLKYDENGSSQVETNPEQVTNEVPEINMHKKNNDMGYKVNELTRLDTNHITQSIHKTENPTIQSDQISFQIKKKYTPLSKYHYFAKPNNSRHLFNLNRTEESDDKLVQLVGTKDNNINSISDDELISNLNFTRKNKVNIDDNNRMNVNISQTAQDKNYDDTTHSTIQNKQNNGVDIEENKYCDKSQTISEIDEDEDESTYSENKPEATQVSYKSTIPHSSSTKEYGETSINVPEVTTNLPDLQVSPETTSEKGTTTDNKQQTREHCVTNTESSTNYATTISDQRSLLPTTSLVTESLIYDQTSCKTTTKSENSPSPVIPLDRTKSICLQSTTVLSNTLIKCSTMNPTGEMVHIEEEHYDETGPILKNINEISIMKEALADLTNISNLPENIIVTDFDKNKDETRSNTDKLTDVDLKE